MTTQNNNKPDEVKTKQVVKPSLPKGKTTSKVSGLFELNTKRTNQEQ